MSVDFLRPITGTLRPGAPWLIVRAMISAAMADRHISTNQAVSRINQLCLSRAEKAFLLREIYQPKSVEELGSTVEDAQTATEVYVAALISTDVTLPDGADYLAALALQLRLDRRLIDSIHTRAKDGSVMFIDRVGETAEGRNFEAIGLKDGQKPQSTIAGVVANSDQGATLRRVRGAHATA